VSRRLLLPNDCRVPKPSQSSNRGGGGDLRFAQVDVPLSAIPAFDRIAGLCKRHPNSNGEYANANDFGVRLKALTDLARNKCSVGPGLIVGGINFGWLAVWVLMVGWLSGF
jgi:hypothetical protein